MTVSRSAVPKKILGMVFATLGLGLLRATDVTVSGSDMSRSYVPMYT